MLGSYCWTLPYVGACPMPRVDKHIKKKNNRMAVIDSLEF